MLQKLLSPNSIAIIGASNDLSKPGGLVLNNILSKGFAGKLLAVNPKSTPIQGLQAYPSIKALPFTPDLALIAVPARYVRQSLEELVHKGTRVVIVLSAGFGELGEEGKREEQILAEIADQHNMLLLGPNCLGAMTYTHASKFDGILPEMTQGGIDFLSGSGAMIDYLAEQAIRRGLPFGSFLTVGNSAQTGVTDLLTLFNQSEQTNHSQLKLIYLESLKKPQEFLTSARNLVKKGHLLAGIKSGTTQAGSRAAASHTGAMATNDIAVKALFDKAGVIRVPSRLELIDVACVIDCAKGNLDGRRVCVVTDAGGPGVMLADELNRQGFDVPLLREQTQARLTEVLPPGAGVSNPIDCMPNRNGEMIGKVFDILAEDECDTIDYILFMIGDSRLADNWEIFQAVIRAMDVGKIPILPSFCSAISSQEGLTKFRETGKSYFEDEVSMARALSRVVNRTHLTEPVKEITGYDHKKIETVLLGLSGALSPTKARQVLEAAGLRFPQQVELSEKDALKNIAFPFPWAMKVNGPLHKTDVGGVRVNITDLNTAQAVWEELMHIKDATGCLIQRMVSGPEVLIGANREDGFGHLVGFGLGGIYTEALKDVSFALAPLSAKEAENMVHSIRALPLIEGFRSEPGIDLEYLQEWLIRISLLVTDFPQIRELDLNPAKGIAKDVFIVDARIIVD
ncbi:MAG: acetate--CoA ligase family protein [Anaerolineaceae bacterium]|nr:acetate--CoA ligase family protein [Anaerolineaceae bacterium]